MSEKPQRPFVPHRTPNEARVQTGPVEFRIAPPFVHKGAKSAATESPPASITDFLAAELPPPASDSVPEQSMRSISDFMATAESPASIADFLAPESSFESASGESSIDAYELPPVEHFTDAGDADEMFGEGAGPAPDMDPFGSAVADAESEDFGWEETDWQRYDWRSAAALGEAADPEAHSAWAQTDWGVTAGGAPPPPPRDLAESAAKAIADALDGIARRIREGDLVVPTTPAAAPDPATIAATLAALLGVRR